MMKQLYFHTISSKNETRTQINIYTYPGPLNKVHRSSPLTRPRLRARLLDVPWLTRGDFTFGRGVC